MSPLRKVQMAFLPGHPFVLQDWDWEIPPAQLKPPLLGRGLVHVRLRV